MLRHELPLPFNWDLSYTYLSWLFLNAHLRRSPLWYNAKFNLPIRRRAMFFVIFLLILELSKVFKCLNLLFCFLKDSKRLFRLTFFAIRLKKRKLPRLLKLSGFFFPHIKLKNFFFQRLHNVAAYSVVAWLIRNFSRNLAWFLLFFKIVCTRDWECHFSCFW